MDRGTSTGTSTAAAARTTSSTASRAFCATTSVATPTGTPRVSLDELGEWFAGVDEPCGRVKWPWWVNETGDRQVERELAEYQGEEVIR